MAKHYRILLIVLGLTLVTTLGLAFAALSDEPVVTAPPRPSPEDAARLHKLVRKHHPGRLREGEIKTLSLNERDVNLAADLVVKRTPLRRRLFSRTRVLDDAVEVTATLRVGDTPFGTYANMRATFVPEGTAVRLVDAHLGSLHFGGWLARPAALVAYRMLRTIPSLRDFSDAQKLVRKLKVERDQLSVTYKWDTAIADRISERGRKALFDDAELKRLNTLHAVLMQRLPADDVDVDALPLIRDVFEASQRTGGTVMKQNEAALMVLGFYSAGSRGGLFWDRLRLPRPPQRKLRLRGRDDLPRHLLLSAAITVTSDNQLAEAIGLYKERADTRKGSGFSFSDLAADRAGVVLGELAVHKDSAARVQKAMSTAQNDRVFLPRMDGLPDRLSKQRYERLFGDLDGREQSPEYKQLTAEIEKRIADCKLYGG